MTIQNESGLLQQATNVQTNTVTKKGNTEMNNEIIAEINNARQANLPQDDRTAPALYEALGVKTQEQLIIKLDELNRRPYQVLKAALKSDDLELYVKAYIIMTKHGIQPRLWHKKLASKLLVETKVELEKESLMFTHQKAKERELDIALIQGTERAERIFGIAGDATDAKTLRAELLANHKLLANVEFPIGLKPDGSFSLKELVDAAQKDELRHGWSATGRPYTIPARKWALNPLNKAIAQLTKTAMYLQELDQTAFDAVKLLTNQLVYARSHLDKHIVVLAELRVLENEEGFDDGHSQFRAECLEDYVALAFEQELLPRKLMQLVAAVGVDEACNDLNLRDWITNQLEDIDVNSEMQKEMLQNGSVSHKDYGLIGKEAAEQRTFAYPVHQFDDLAHFREQYEFKHTTGMRGAVAAAVNLALPRKMPEWEWAAEHFCTKLVDSLGYAAEARQISTQAAWDARKAGADHFKKGAEHLKKMWAWAKERKATFLKAARQAQQYGSFIASAEGMAEIHVAKRSSVMQFGLNKFSRRIYRDLFIMERELTRHAEWLERLVLIRDTIEGAPWPVLDNERDQEKFSKQLESMGREAIDDVCLMDYEGDPLRFRFMSAQWFYIDAKASDVNRVVDGYIISVSDMYQKIEGAISYMRDFHREVRAYEEYLASLGYWDDRENSIFKTGGVAPLYWNMDGTYLTKEEADAAIAKEIDEGIIDIDDIADVVVADENMMI